MKTLEDRREIPGFVDRVMTDTVAGTISVIREHDDCESVVLESFEHYAAASAKVAA